MALTRSLIPFGGTRLARPFATLLDREMEGLIDQFFRPEDGWGLRSKFTPLVNIAETEDDVEVTLELPGMKAEDFHIDMKEGELWISGEKSEEKEEQGKTYHWTERHYGEFRRVISLPTSVNVNKVEAEYKDGVLRIVAPKAEAVKTKHIQVKC